MTVKKMSVGHIIKEDPNAVIMESRATLRFSKYLRELVALKNAHPALKDIPVNATFIQNAQNGNQEAYHKVLDNFAFSRHGAPGLEFEPEQKKYRETVWTTAKSFFEKIAEIQRFHQSATSSAREVDMTDLHFDGEDFVLSPEAEARIIARNSIVLATEQAVDIWKGFLEIKELYDNQVDRLKATGMGLGRSYGSLLGPRGMLDQDDDGYLLIRPDYMRTIGRWISGEMQAIRAKIKA